MHVSQTGPFQARKTALGLSILCENPRHRTGLSTLFPAFVSETLNLFPNVNWLIFASKEQSWPITDSRIRLIRRFPANNRLLPRLWADHFRVPAAAKRLGAAALLTVGFSPFRHAGLPNVMHIFTVHHLSGVRGLRAAYRKWATNHGLKHASLVITNSHWSASHLGVDSDRLLVSYEGLNREVFRPEGPVHQQYKPGSYILWASNFYRYKRVELALAAYAQMPTALRMQFPMLLVGGDWHEGRANAEAIAQNLGVREQVHFLGWVDDECLPALYRGARAHVLSTAEETFGRTVLEAMACGCPCVLQDLPVLREVTAGSAVFVDYNDPGAAADALARICTDDAWAQNLRVKGLQRASEFSFSRLARERVEAILRMLERSHAKVNTC